MFIGIAGPEGAGKRTVSQLLVEHLEFQAVGVVKMHSKLEMDQMTRSGYSLDEGLASSGAEFRATPPGKDEKGFSGLNFESAEALMDHVTRHWKERFVLDPVMKREELEVYRRRPCFLLMYVDAPIMVRYRRLLGSSSCPEGGLEEFVKASDAALFPSGPQFLPYAGETADLRLNNGYDQIEDLIPEIQRLFEQGTSLLRPSWDMYFSSLALLTAKRSNCMKRRVGAILVRDRHILAAGYNGTPRGLPNCLDGGCTRCNAGEARCGEGLETCLCLHAEENALLEAGRERIVGGEWCTMYCSTCPCLGCAKKIVQAGVKEVVYSRTYGMDDLTARLFSLAGVQLRQYDPSILPSASM